MAQIEGLKTEDAGGALQNYVVIRDLSEDEEPSHWTMSQLAMDIRTDEKVLISRLNKTKFIAHGFREQSGSETEEEREAIKAQAIAKYQGELNHFVNLNKKVVGLSHPAIAKVIDFGVDQKNMEAVVTVEYVDGAPVFDVTNGMPILGMIPIFLSVLEGLNFMHFRDILHLNLKSKRVLVKAGFPSVAKLTDYGYALSVGKIPDGVFGSAIYSAPEVIRGEKDKIGVVSDLYSFAALAYSCMARVFPFPERENAEHSYELKEIVHREEEPLKPSLRNTLMIRRECDKAAADKIAKLEDIIMALLKASPDDRPHRTAWELISNISSLFKEELEKKRLGDATITRSASIT
ncbi:MAG: protein kinase [Pseudomonadota bacterium]